MWGEVCYSGKVGGGGLLTVFYAVLADDEVSEGCLSTSFVIHLASIGFSKHISK